MKGTIRWFDGMSGEGMVCGEDGKSYYLHFTSIEGVSKNNHHWPNDKDQVFLKTIKGRFCTFDLFVDPTFTQVNKLILE